MHLQELNSELTRYFDTNPAKMVRDPSSTTDQPIFILQPKEPIPSRFGFIIGDCFQNLRSSLDYLVRELVIAAGNKPTDREMFPICKTPKGFKGAVERGQLEGIPADAFKEIESIQPYNLGDDWEKSTLWVVDELTNINKHRRVPLTMLRGAQSHSAVPLGIGPFDFLGHRDDVLLDRLAVLRRPLQSPP